MNAELVNRRWARQCAEAIVLRNGVKMMDGIVFACKDEVVPSSSLPAIGGDRGALGDAIAAIAQRLDMELQAAAAEADPERFPQLLDIQEASLYVEVLTRVAVASILHRYQLQLASGAAGMSATSKPINVDEDGGDDDETQRRQSELAEMYERAGRVYVKGLLYAFEAFQQAHMMGRQHYAPSSGSRQRVVAPLDPQQPQKRRSSGTVGWDTLVLLHLVQMVRSAAQGVVDLGEGTLGDTFRNWRKLLVFLQTADAGTVAEHSRRRGALAVLNGLLLLSFQNGNTHQCRILLSSIEQSEKLAASTGDETKSIIRPAQHMISEIIKFRYCQGRMKLYERKYSEAFEALATAYALLPPLPSHEVPAAGGAGAAPGNATLQAARAAQRSNKLRILFYLLTAGMCMGRMPPPQVMDADATIASIFAPILEALQRGDAVAYGALIEQRAQLFRRRGVYLPLLHSKILCFRGLLQRSHAIVSSLGADSSRLQIPMLVAVYHEIINEKPAAGQHLPAATTAPRDVPPADGYREAERELEQMDDDVMMMRVAKLISRGMVKGYISNEFKTVVLSKKDPFPQHFGA